MQNAWTEKIASYHHCRIGLYLWSVCASQAPETPAFFTAMSLRSFVPEIAEARLCQIIMRNDIPSNSDLPSVPKWKRRLGSKTCLAHRDCRLQCRQTFFLFTLRWLVSVVLVVLVVLVPTPAETTCSFAIQLSCRGSCCSGRGDIEP